LERESVSVGNQRNPIVGILRNWNKHFKDTSEGMQKRVILVAGARPNFMKIAPIWLEMNRFPSHFTPIVLHTGQHYDYEMSKVFFEDLDLPEPHYFLGVGSGTHAEQTAKTMIEFEKVLLKDEPDLVVVSGDVNSTLACSVTAKKLMIPIAHVEAGLRSFDMTMPEEINRKLTDAISDLLFTPSMDGNRNLVREGVSPDKINFVGNIMIDSLIRILNRITELDEGRVLSQFGVERGHYVLVTLHRPSNVDKKETLWKLLNFLSALSARVPIIFPVHPRTKKNMNGFGVNGFLQQNFKIIEPLRYREFIALEKRSQFVLTDSGGIQEETTYLNVPCLTLRPNTERPVTIIEGTNELVTIDQLEEKADLILTGSWKQGKIPELWDGKTAERIVNILRELEL
jgi:UDP-N-acetylglucosamine 2-epimerase (non-hydrolysing)